MKLNKYLIPVMKLILNFFVLVCWKLTFLPIAFASADDANTPIKIGSYLVPGLIKEDGTGVFRQLNTAIFMEISKNSELTILSLNRVRKGLKDGELDAYFPELWENLADEKHQYIVSKPIFYKRIILFTLKGSDLTHISDFKNKQVLGAVQGFAYGKEIKFNPRLNLTFQEDDVTNISLLLNKRVDGVLGGYPGTVMALKGSGAASKIDYDLENPVAILESFYVCKNDSDGVRLCDSINKAIESLVRKGALELNDVTGFSRFTPAESD